MSEVEGFDRVVATFERYQHDPNDPHSLSDNVIRCIDEDANGELWIVAGDMGSSSNQLNRFNPQTSQVTRHPIALSKRLVSVLVDRSGLIWAGSQNDGLFKLNPKALKFPYYTMQPDEPNSFYGKYIWAICEDRNGKIWLGGEMEGLYRLDRKSGKYTYFKNDPSHPDSLSAARISAIIEDRRGAIWIGSNEGLHKFDPRKKVFKRYQHDPQNPHSIADNRIYSILEDHSGVLWVGNYTGTLHRFDPATEIFTRYREFAENSDWYSGAGIFGIAEDDQGVLWLGTNGDGLVKFDPAIGKLKGFKKNSFDNVTLSRPLIDRAGRLWISGLGIGGLALFDRKTETVIKIITEADGLLHHDIYGIEEDNHGNLWISSARGLSKYNPDRGTFHHYFKEDGLQNNEFRYYAHHKSRSGEMFFGGQYGFNAFYPDSIKDSDYAPPIVFTDLRINNRPVAIGKDSPLRKDIAVAEEITLAYDQNDIAITFAALDFSMPERNLYSFKLENYDEDWRAPSQERTAVYTNLDPGEYVFRAKGTNYDGVWNEAGASLRIVITPPWYQTAWAYGFYGLLFFAGVVAADRVQRRRLIRQERERTMQRELEQARELEKTHHALQAAHEHLKATQQQLITQEKLASLGQLTAGIAHEIKNPLNFVNNFAALSVDLAAELREGIVKRKTKNVNGDDFEDMEEIIAMLEQNAEKINHHGQRADNIVKSMMQHARGSSHERVPTDINHLLDEAVNLVYHGMRANDPSFNVTIEREYDASIGKIEVVPQDITRVFLNMVNNACYAAVQKQKAKSKEQKANGGGFSPTIAVSTKNFGDKIEIRIRDNGNGIPPDIREKIFNPFFTTKPTGQGTGLGLSISYDIIVQQHRGEIQVETEEGKFTEFVVRLPKA
jgi:signal transduction histidine kinase/ligand-binding sensor domain-containing protein